MGREESLAEVARRLSGDLGRLTFGAPVSHVYDPLVYAWEPFSEYLRRYGTGTGRVLLVGMNPGPFGMAQTGVPFGDVGSVRGWLGIERPVGKPAVEHPKRPVLGFAIRRGEVSGQRLWGWAKDRFGTPDHFFRRFFVANWCPLCFLDEGGRNLTPDKVAAGDRPALYARCDAALRRKVEILEPVIVVGIGSFVEKRAKLALAGLSVPIGRVLHPSPASPAAQHWAATAERELAALGISVTGSGDPAGGSAPL